jgi:2-phospho-L-lactate guanylyltransferase
LRTIAFVPFKSFIRAKQRLRTRFGDSDVEAIGRAMLEDVLEALTHASGLAEVRVLTDDPEVGQVAERCGANARICSPDPGLNPAIEEANAEAQQAGCDATLVVLGDIPLLRASDVEAVCRAGTQSPVVIVPSDDGGTALMLRCPPDAIPASFGPESFEHHLALCRERGIEPVVIEGIPETVRTDLDTPEDAARILGAGGSGRTVELLRKLVGT